MRTAHALVLLLCALVTTAGGPAIAASGPVDAGFVGGVPSAQEGTGEGTETGSDAGATQIDGCETITESGTYVLAGDVQASNQSSCIRIEADDVTLDGDGYRLDGATPEADVDQFVDQVFQGEPSPDDERWGRAGVVAVDGDNVTVRDLETTGWLVGVSFVAVTGGVVENVTARSNGIGVVQVGGANGSVVGTNATDNAGIGVFLLETRDGTVSTVEATNNGLLGVYLRGTENSSVEGSTASENDVAGVLLEGTEGGVVRDVEARSNGVAGVYLLESTGTVVSEATANENSQVGVYVRDSDGVAVRDVAADANAAGVVLENARDSTVVGAEAQLNRQTGIAAFAANRSRIANSTTSGNEFAGVHVIQSDSFAVRDVNASQNAVGLAFENATNGTAAGGAFGQNGRTGITLVNTSGTEIVGANASRNDYHGVFVVNASGNSVRESNASYNGLAGVFLRNATDNVVTNNTLLANAIAGVFEEDATENRLADNRDGATEFPSTDGGIGREGGIVHDQDIEIDQSDGLNETELSQYVYRTIARAEYIRGLEYNQSVDVEVISRSENRRRTLAQPPDPGATALWRNQVWEAAFLIGEDGNASEELDEFRGEQVLGYYLSGANKMVIVTPDNSTEVDSVTLIHEFVHALQDMHLDLAGTAQGSRTEDAQRARNGLVEGDASYVEEQFELRCGSVWNCIASNSTSPRSAEIPDLNPGVRRVTIQPYVDGPGYVDRLRQQGGWDAVDDAYSDVPNSTEQIIHPEKADEEPVPIEIENEPTNGWQPFDGTDLPFEGENGTTTLGEAGIYTMFWYQAVEYGIPVIDAQTHFVPEGGAFDRLNYTSAPSEGWGNDVLVPYRKDDQGAYLWKTAWDSEEDAEEFQRAYVQMLRGHNATRVGPRTWVVSDGPFADAFHVVRRGKTVTITNAPEVGDLEDVRPGIQVQQGSGGNETSSNGMNASGTNSSGGPGPVRWRV